MSQLGRLRCTLNAEIFLNDELVISASQKGFFISLESMRPMAIPNDIRDIYTKHNHS